MKKIAEKYSILLIPFFSILAGFTIFFRDGWPDNHDGNAIFTRGKIFFDLIVNHHNLFPMWTVYGNHGLGSPMPFFYHRLYYYLISFINLGFDDILLSVKLSIPLLLLAGGTAVYLLIKKIFDNKLYGIIGSGLYIFSNYLYTDWLVRGAAAEFTALIIIPWILLGFLQIAGGFKKRYFLLLGFYFSLLMYAHSLIFIFSFFLWIFFFIAYRKEWKKFFPGLLLFLLPVILIDLPFIIPYYRLIDRFNLKIAATIFQVKNSFVQFSRYLFDDWYIIGANRENFSVEISRFYFIPLFLFSLFCIIKSKKAFPVQLKDIYKDHYIRFTAFALLFYLVLQMNFSLPFYQLIPFLNYIQFPWRLLSIITPLSVILFFYYIPSAAGLMIKNNRNFITLIVMLFILLLQIFWVGGNSQFYRYLTIPGKELREKMMDENLDENSTWAEYQPVPFHKKDVKSLIENHGCKILYINTPELLTGSREFDKIIIRLNKNQTGTIVLNQLKSPFLTLKCPPNIDIREGPCREIIFSVSSISDESTIEIGKTSLIDLCLNKGQFQNLCWKYLIDFEFLELP